MANASQRAEVIDKVGKLLSERFHGDYRQAFEHYDHDKNDGGISKPDLQELLKDAGIGD